jgi:hypothetical protein
MNKQAERAAHCESYCPHVYRCTVHWGADCKRQGGQKIPRMKTVPREFVKEPEPAAEPVKIETRHEKRSRVREILDTVRTKVVGW